MIPQAELAKVLSLVNELKEGRPEVEVRFRKYHGNATSSSVSVQSFSQLRSSLSDHLTCEIYESESNGPLRKKTVKETSTVTWMTKNANLFKYDSNVYPLRLSLSQEIDIEEAPPVFRPLYKRQIIRHSCYLLNGSYRVDLSQVKTDASVDYQVEVEVVCQVTMQSLSTLNSICSSLMLKLYETDHLYIRRDYELIVNYITFSLSTEKTKFRRTIETECLYQSRNLHLDDVVDGGLFTSKENGGCKYNVTTKADGVRKLLIYHEVFGTLLISPPDNVNVIDKSIPPNTHGFMIEVEHIPVDKRKEGAPTAKYWLLAFDCLYNNEMKDCRDLPHDERMTYALKASTLQHSSDKIFLDVKPFLQFQTIRDMFESVGQAISICNDAPYETDGLIFTSIQMKYNSGNDNASHNLSTRRLTKCMDVCKWKPSEQLTIDFSVKWVMTKNKTRRLELYTGERGGELSKFNGSITHPFKGFVSGKYASCPLLQGIENGSIVEFRFEGELIPTRVRNDKNRPNRTQNALDTWELVHEPVTLDILTGRSCVFMRRYLNDVKRRLYIDSTKHLPANFNNQPVVLLDIGSGQGGSLNKTKAFDLIINVELDRLQNEEHCRRARMRGMNPIMIRHEDDLTKLNAFVFNKASTTKDLYILEVSVFEEKFINNVLNKLLPLSKGKVDVISAMMCLGYLWESSSSVQSFATLIDTCLKPSGVFAYMTLDGDLLQSTFIPPWSANPPYESIDQLPEYEQSFSFGSLTYKPSIRKVKIDLPGTRVNDQEEYEVRMDDLTVRLSGFSLIECNRANQSTCMSHEEAYLSSLFSGGLYKKVNTNVFCTSNKRPHP